jgi:hypothetical protein
VTLTKPLAPARLRPQGAAFRFALFLSVGIRTAIAALFLAAVTWAMGAFAAWRWYGWVVASPLLYTLWLLLCLGLCRGHMTLRVKRHLKARQTALPPPGQRF